MSLPPALIDVIFVALILLTTYALTSEGAWGAALMFFNVLFGAMIAFNFYEPLAGLIDSTGIGWGFSDTLSLMLIFCVSVFLLRITTETLAPAMVRFPMPIYHVTRLFFGLATSLVTFAVILLAFHAAPIHKQMFGYITYETKPPFGLALDHHWLGFFQYTTGDIFARYGVGARDPYRSYGKTGGNQLVPVNIFDPRGRWLLDRQESRPYGEGAILKESAGGGEGAAPTGGGPGGGMPGGPAGPGGGMPGGPAGPGGQPSRPIGGPAAPAAPL